MTIPGRVVRVQPASHSEGAATGAVIWARATQQRDGRPVTAQEAAVGIYRRLELPGATVLLARQAGHAVGFALMAPHEHALELFYLGVDPEAWGCGVAYPLLLAVEAHARTTGRETVELWVLDDNTRAIGRYERAGWSRTDDVKQDPRGRLERRFVRRVSAST